MIEVKSKTSATPEEIDDMAYTTMVMSLSGFEVSKISLLLVSKDFRPGMNKKDFFTEIDFTEKVLEKAEKFKSDWRKVQDTLNSQQKPPPELIFDCKKCELFKDCTGKGIKHHILEIPRISSKKFKALHDN